MGVTSMQPTQPHVAIRGVTKRYGDRTILDAVDLDVMPGDLCAVVGPSGCGKSTLLRMVLGQETPDEGTIGIDGRDGGFVDDRRGIVQQTYSLLPHLTALGNVSLSARLRCRSWRRERAGAEAEARGLLDRVGLAEAADKYPHELSGGMRQRVAIVQALAARPKVLLMDEPFAALDPTSRESLQMFLLELWERDRTTIFFVTHDITEAIFLGTRIVLLSPHDGDAPEADRPGARVVMDERIVHALSRVADKESPAFLRIRESVMRRGFAPRIAAREAFDGARVGTAA